VQRIEVARSCRSVDWSPTSNPQNIDSRVQARSRNVRNTRADADEEAGVSDVTRRDFAPILLVSLVTESVLRADTRCPHSPKRPAVRFVQYIPLWYIILGGTRWRSWLRHCATSREVAGSIPDGVIEIFH